MNSKYSNKISLAILLCLCLSDAYAFTSVPRYEVIDLLAKEREVSEVLAVNDSGQVAGMYWDYGKKQFFLWDEQSGISLIDLPETATIIVLNNFGQVTGNYKNAAGYDRGFFWDPCCGMCDIGTLGGRFTRVYGMNDHGQIVGESESRNTSLFDGRRELHAFLWQSCCMTDLVALTGDLGLFGDKSQATGINNQGQIIGTANSLIVRKGKILRTKPRSVFWQNSVIEGVDPADDNEWDLDCPTSCKNPEPSKPENCATVDDFKKMASTIEELQKRLAEETAKLESLQYNTSFEINNNAKLLEFQKTQLIDLQQKLMESQRLQHSGFLWE